jgi:hypothetical protein
MAIIDGQLVVFGIDRFVPASDLHNTTPPNATTDLTAIDWSWNLHIFLQSEQV